MHTQTTAVANWQSQKALERYQMIAPLLDNDLDEAKRIQQRKKIADTYDVSIRSLYRYEKSYREENFQGLIPKDRSKHYSQALPENFEELLDEAIQLRKEVPERSVAQIITILEMENRVKPGILKRSTLERHLHKAGFGSEHMKTYKDARDSSSRRFTKPHRMMLVQGDIKYGPILPIGKNGKKVRTYLSSIIDDHSRFVLYSRFYESQDETIVEDTFHQAIIRYGTFDSCYLDNGTQYVAKQLRLSLSRLGIRIRHAPVRSGKSKGKIEKFHQVVDAFNREAKLKKIKTLQELNYYWQIYLDEYYHKTAHDGIREYYESFGATLPETGISPETEFNRDSRSLTYLDVQVVAEAFLHHEERKVDKGACISFHGKKYETKPELIGQYVEISYDPLKADVIKVSHAKCPTFEAKPLQLNSYCNQKVALPIGMQNQTPSTSRFLDALERKHKESTQKLADAISFADYRKEDADHV